MSAPGPEAGIEALGRSGRQPDNRRPNHDNRRIATPPLQLHLALLSLLWAPNFRFQNLCYPEGDGILVCGGTRPKFRRRGAGSGIVRASGSQLRYDILGGSLDLYS